MVSFFLLINLFLNFFAGPCYEIVSHLIENQLELLIEDQFLHILQKSGVHKIIRKLNEFQKNSQVCSKKMKILIFLFFLVIGG